MTDKCDNRDTPMGVFIEIKGISTPEQQEIIYDMFKTLAKVVEKKHFKVIMVQQKEGISYNQRRTCDNHETLHEIHGDVLP